MKTADPDVVDAEINSAAFAVLAKFEVRLPGVNGIVSFGVTAGLRAGVEVSDDTLRWTVAELMDDMHRHLLGLIENRDQVVMQAAAIDRAPSGPVQ